MEVTQQKTSDDHGLKGLLQTVKLVAGGQDWLPLTPRKSRLLPFSSASSLCSQIVPGLRFPSYQTVIYHMKMLWALWLKNIQYYLVINAYQSLTFTAPTFAHLRPSALPGSWFTCNLAFLLGFYWAFSESPIEDPHLYYFKPLLYRNCHP